MGDFKRILPIFTISIAAIAGIVSCKKADKGTFFYGALSTEQKIIISSSSTVTAAPFIVAQYSIDGIFEKVLFDSTFSSRILRSMAAITPFQFLISTDTVDGILKFDYFNGLSSFISNGNLTGNIYNLRRAKNGDVFVIETTAIESFDASGNRIGNPRIPNTAIGACQITTAARGLAINDAGTVIVGSQGNDDILFFDVSSPSATTCLAANGSLGNVDPIAIVAHSDGYVYVAHSGGTDAVVRFNGDGSGTASPVWTGLTTSNPTAMAEMPDGSLIVALDGTNNIIRILTDGTVVASPFIQDGFTFYVQDIMISDSP